MADLLDDVKFTDSHVTKIPVLMLDDVSGSMGHEGRIEAVNDGMEQLQEFLSGDTLVALQTDICVVGFNHDFGYQEFCSGKDFKPPRFTARGGNAICAGDPFCFGPAGQSQDGIPGSGDFLHPSNTRDDHRRQPT